MKTSLGFVLPAVLLALPVAGLYFYSKPQPDRPAIAASPPPPLAEEASANVSTAPAPATDRVPDQKFIAPTPTPAPTLAAATAIPSVAKLAPGVLPAVQPAAKAFDPRFVQPATRMGLVGVRDAETVREILAQEDKTTAEKAAAIAWAQANGWPIRGDKPGGGAFELMRLDEDGRPAYHETHNEANFDFLRFEMDNVDIVPPISGQGGGWQEITLGIPAGTHSLRWLYTKDGSVSTGQDRGWIDQMAILRPDFGVGALTFHSAGTVAVVPAYKDPTAGFFLETSTDLVTWTEVGGMIPPRHQNVNLIVTTPGNRRFFRLLYKPEMVYSIENAGFELPVVSAQTFASNAPGWGPDNDGSGTTSFENITGFAAAGTQHLSIAAGAFSEMKGTFRGWRGVHSVSVAVGNRSGFTQAGNLSSIVLTSGPELARLAQGAAALPSGTWFTPVPASFDSFETNLDTFYDYKVRLESTGNRSFFDNVRVVSEPQ